MKRILLLLIAISIIVQLVAQHNSKVETFSINASIGQGLCSFSNAQYLMTTDQGFSSQFIRYPYIRLALEKRTSKGLAHQLSIGFTSNINSYQLRAYDCELANYPDNIEYRELFYDRSYTINNIVVDYRYYFINKDVLSLYVGVEMYNSILFKPKYHISETITNYGYYNHSAGETIDTRHQAYQISTLKEGIHKRFALSSGIQFTVRPSVYIGFDVSYKFLGERIVYDNLSVDVDLLSGDFNYNQYVEMYNKHLIISLNAGFKIYSGLTN